MIPKRPGRQWRSASALYQGVGSRGYEDAPVVASPGPRCHGVSYAGAPFSLSVGVPFSVTPTIVGATPRYWYVKPPLPAGLTINNGDGTISGTPTTPTSLGTYVVHAIHSDDEALRSVQITVT